MYSTLFLLGLTSQALASPAVKRSVSPQVASIQVIANVTDPAVTRDSCGSVRIGNRAFWTCRDTEAYDLSTGQGKLPVIANTASWTDFASDGTPLISHGPAGAASTGSNPILKMYGGHPTSAPTYFPIQSDECPDYGACSDGSRWAIWPDSPPMIVNPTASSGITGYTWIKKAHLKGLTSLDNEPASSLYKISYSPGSDANALPSVTLVNEQFWGEGQIAWGVYGNVVMNGVAYLYGQTDQNKGTTLAKVPAGSVEDKSQYQYWYNGGWTKTMPGINDTAAIIPNAGAGGQGTFYYSDYFKSYVWIGQYVNQGFADFYITTAPAPQGPWIKPYRFYQAANGDNGIAGGYTLQANPGLLKSSSQNGIYITWTKQYNSATYGSYITPLAYVTWK